MSKLTALLILICFPLMASAYEVGEGDSHAPSDQVPKELINVGITEHLGQNLNLNLNFKDENGQAVRLGQFFHPHRPVLMAMVYYSCPNLCNYQLNGLIDVVKKMNGGGAGKDYEVVAVSMDSKETPDLASKKKANYMKALDQPAAVAGWHMLVGDEKNVKELAAELGFSYKWDENLKQFAHASATYVVTPDGQLSRYIYGIEFDPRTLRFSLVEASNGKIGNIIEKIALFCFQFDPAKNKYTFYAFNLMRIGGLFTVLVLAIVLIPVWIRERKRQAATVQQSV
jgi:protein SCO1/2